MEKPVVGLRKREQISKANRYMFFSIAGVSVVVGFSLVLIVFLAQRIWFGEKVIIEKNNTATVLQKNLSSVSGLKDNIRVLNTNQDLMFTRLNADDPAIQSVLDALPADANSTALATSLQSKLLNNIPDVTVESLSVEPVTDSSAFANTIVFGFSVSTKSDNKEGLRQVLLRIEKSIRPLNITNLSVDRQGERSVMTVKGVSYYDSPQVVQLTDKEVRP